jgi:hypothetical protein
MAAPLFPIAVYKHRGLAADQHLTQEEWNQVGVEVTALEEFYEVALIVCAVGADTTYTTPTTANLGGVMIPRSILDLRMPNGRWYASAYFFAGAPAGITATWQLMYQKHDLTTVVLGSKVVSAGMATEKRSIEPVEITNLLLGETVICVRLAIIFSGSSGSVTVSGPASILLQGKRNI